jgi:hypothetical protein
VRLTVFLTTTMMTQMAHISSSLPVRFDAAATAEVGPYVCDSALIADADVGVDGRYASAPRSREPDGSDALLGKWPTLLTRHNAHCDTPIKRAKRAVSDDDVAVRFSAAELKTTSCEITRTHQQQRIATPNVVAFYSSDDRVCEPLARALTRMVRGPLASSDVLDRYGNDVILKRARFTLPKPLPAFSYEYPSQRRELYDLDITNDGRHWEMLFSSMQDYMFLWSTAWYVLKLGHSFHPTGVDIDRPPDADVAAANPAERDKSLESIALPLNPAFHKMEWTFKFAAGKPPIDAGRDELLVAIDGFTRPLLYVDASTYMLSDRIDVPRGYNAGTFALTRFTADLKLETTCLLSTTDQLTLP